MNPTGSAFPHECHECVFYQLAVDRGLFEKKYKTWCVKYDFAVSEHKDACRSFHAEEPAPTFKCCYCGELIYTAMITHCDVCRALKAVN